MISKIKLGKLDQAIFAYSKHLSGLGIQPVYFWEIDWTLLHLDHLFTSPFPITSRKNEHLLRNLISFFIKYFTMNSKESWINIKMKRFNLFNITR